MAFRAGGADFAGVKTKKRARERALCVRQNWGHRAKSCFLPLLIRLARLSRTKPRGCPGIRFVRRPYAVREKGTLVQWQHATKAVPECKDQRRRSLPDGDARLTCAQARGNGGPAHRPPVRFRASRGSGKSSACDRDGAAKKRPHAAPLGLSSAAGADRLPGKTG